MPAAPTCSQDELEPELALKVSANGMLMECPAALAAGAELGRFRLAGDRRPWCGRARVVRQAGDTRGGIAFLGLAAEARRRLEAFGAGPHSG